MGRLARLNTQVQSDTNQFTDKYLLYLSVSLTMYCAKINQ